MKHFHTCGGCDNRWKRDAIAHCGSCHISFSSVSGFDMHRHDGECLNPSARGLVEVSGIWQIADSRPHWKVAA